MKCPVPKLLKRVQEASRFILDKQGSSARGAARTALALVHARHPELDLEYCTAGAPADCDASAVFAQVQGLDNRIVRMIDHGTFYDKMPLTPLNLKKQRDRLRQEEAERLKGENAEEDVEHSAEEAEQSEEESSQEPAGDEAAQNDSDASVSSPSDQASPERSGPPEN